MGRGARITDMRRVLWLADERKAVCLANTGSILPAAVVQNWQAKYLASCIDQGWLYEYAPESKEAQDG